MYYLKKILYIIIFINTSLFSSQELHQKSDLKAYYIYNMINYIKKQGDSNTSKRFNICTQNRVKLAKSLQKFDKSILNDKKIHIYTITNNQDYIDYCNMIILPNLTQLTLQKFLIKAKKNHIITISDVKECTSKGVMIYLKDLNFKIEFEINLKAMREADIKLSSRLLKLSNITQE